MDLLSSQSKALSRGHDIMIHIPKIKVARSDNLLYYYFLVIYCYYLL